MSRSTSALERIDQSTTGCEMSVIHYKQYGGIGLTACGLKGEEIPPASCIHYPTAKGISCEACINSVEFANDIAAYDIGEYTPRQWFDERWLPNKTLAEDTQSPTAQTVLHTAPEMYRDNILYWERCWDVVGPLLTVKPEMAELIGKTLARNKPQGSSFPQEAAQLLNLRRRLGAAGWYNEVPGKHTPCVQHSALLAQWWLYTQQAQSDGLALFNAVQDLCPELADELRDTRVDCRTDDRKRVTFYGRAVGYISTVRALDTPIITHQGMYPP